MTTGSRTLYLLAASAAASLPFASAGGTVPPQSPSAVLTQALSPAQPASTQAHTLRPLRLGGIAAAKRTATTRLRLVYVADGGGSAAASAAWLPTGCRLVEVGPANSGYTMNQECAAPRGFTLPRGYILVRGTASQKVHTTTGASG